MEPVKKPFPWILVIVGVCCFGGLCVSGIVGAVIFSKQLASSIDEGHDDYGDEVSGGGDVAEAGGTRWYDPQNRFSIVFPDDWELSDPPPEGIVVASGSLLESGDDTFAENVNVVYELIPEGYSQNDYIAAVSNQTQTLTNFREQGSGPWDLEGQPGYWLEYTADVFAGETSHNMMFVTTAPGEAFVITCSSVAGSFPRWESQMRGVAESFQLE